MAEDSEQHMACMEVWGGNQATENSVTMSGLDAWIYCRPYQQSDGGGDVYYVSSCATGRITRLLLADVSGHGQVVSETAMGLRKLMQKYVNFIDQRAFVRSMNRQFSELSTDGCFATAVVSTFFAPRTELSLCIAGHPVPLIYRAATKRWTRIDHEVEGSGANIPLGIEDIAQWEQFGVRLRVGDLVLCYTDSLIESRDATGEMLGVDGLLRTIASVDVSDSSQVIPRLLDAIAATGSIAPDDVTALLFRPNGGGATVSIADKILAPVRVLRGVFGSFLPGGGPMPWPELSLANIGGAIFAPFNRLRARRSQQAQ
ncbi:MAG TPA: PP2C family protein-serine/threonine phosphatase [Tepidisphaeraceae bacterium]|jgi:serine phosphatase RsbU (regulator of sigma subunit)